MHYWNIPLLLLLCLLQPIRTERHFIDGRDNTVPFRSYFETHSSRQKIDSDIVNHARSFPTVQRDDRETRLTRRSLPDIRQSRSDERNQRNVEDVRREALRSRARDISLNQADRRSANGFNREARFVIESRNAEVQQRARDVRSANTFIGRAERHIPTRVNAEIRLERAREISLEHTQAPLEKREREQITERRHVVRQYRTTSDVSSGRVREQRIRESREAGRRFRTREITRQQSYLNRERELTRERMPISSKDTRAVLNADSNKRLKNDVSYRRQVLRSLDRNNVRLNTESGTSIRLSNERNEILRRNTNVRNLENRILETPQILIRSERRTFKDSCEAGKVNRREIKNTNLLREKRDNRLNVRQRSQNDDREDRTLRISEERSSNRENNYRFRSRLVRDSLRPEVRNKAQVEANRRMISRDREEIERKPLRSREHTRNSRERVANNMERDVVRGTRGLNQNRLTSQMTRRNLLTNNDEARNEVNRERAISRIDGQRRVVSRDTRISSNIRDRSNSREDAKRAPVRHESRIDERVNRERLAKYETIQTVSRLVRESEFLKRDERLSSGFSRKELKLNDTNQSFLSWQIVFYALQAVYIFDIIIKASKSDLHKKKSWTYKWLSLPATKID